MYINQSTYKKKKKKKETPRCLSKYIIFSLRCILSRRKCSYQEHSLGPRLHYFSGMDRYSDFLLYIIQRSPFGYHYDSLVYSRLINDIRNVIKRGEMYTKIMKFYSLAGSFTIFIYLITTCVLMIMSFV